MIGYVKPGAETAEIVKSATLETKELTKSDVIVVLGGTNYIGKNNAYKGIKNKICSGVPTYECYSFKCDSSTRLARMVNCKF